MPVTKLVLDIRELLTSLGKGDNSMCSGAGD